MNDYEKHVQAIENRCRICLQSKTRDNLRNFSEKLKAVRDAYGIDYEYESNLCFYPQHICIGCASSILKGRVPKLASLGSHSIPRKVTTKHSGIGCSICETYTGEDSSKGLISDHPSEIAGANLSPPMKRVCWSTPGEQEVCKHCLSPQKIGHVCSRVNLIENTIELLEKKGIDEEVVAALLRKRAVEDNSPEFEMHTLKIRLLNGRYVKPFESPSITKEDLSRLVSEISLSTESLRKLCNWMKARGIKTAGSRSIYQR